jgi:hypothetical protein
LKGSADAPSVPDPRVTAQAQGTANVNTAAASSALNNVNTVTPYGSTTYDTTGSYTTPDGQVVPRYTQTTALNPLAQAILTGQQTVAGNLIPGAEQLSGAASAAFTNPLDFNTPQSDILNSSPTQISDRAADAAYAKQKGFLDPQWDQQSRQLEDQLSRQGIPVGSEAYQNAMKAFNTSKTQAYDAASTGAIANGTSAASNLFNMALAGQQQNLSQQQLAQNNPLDILQKIFSSSPSSPQQPINQPGSIPVAPTDVIGATNASTNAAMNQYQTNIGQQNSMFGGLAGLGGAAIRAFI